MKSLLHIALFILTAASSAQAIHIQPLPMGAPKNCPAGLKVDIPAGTLVILETNEKLYSHAVTVGKYVQMRVRTNVVVNGKTVIRTGCQAVGRVKSIEKSTFNSPEMITLELFYVQAVDGQQISLHGNEQTIPALMPNEPATAPVNILMTAQLMNNEEVEVP